MPGRISLIAIAAVAGLGCSVPPSRLPRDIRDICDKQAEMQKAVDAEDWDSALAKADEITLTGSELSAAVLLGDPLRSRLDEALAGAREVRERVRKREQRGSSRADQQLEQTARKALEDAAANTEAPKPLPDDADSIVLLGSASRRAPVLMAPAGGQDSAETGPQPEADLGRHTVIVRGDREGDITDDEAKPAREAGADAPKGLRIDATTPPIVISQKPITRGKGVAAYFTVVNNTPDTVYIVAANADFIRETGADSGFAGATFIVDGFAPSWDDILGSKGETLTGDGLAIMPMTGLQLVAVGMKPSVGTIEKVKIEVRLRSGKVHRATGPDDGK